MAEPVAVPVRQWRTATDKSTGRFYVRDPLSQEILPVSRDEAEDFLLRKGYQPVDETSAREYHKAELYKQYGEDNPLEAVTTGLTRGLTGGLEDFAMPPDEAKLRQAVIDEHPWLGGLSEAASTVVGLGKFSKLAKFTPVGALDAAGQLLTEGARKIVTPTSITRAAGVAAEGAAYGGIQAAREAHMYEQPLGVQQVASGMLGGAIIGGAIGGPLGLLEKRGASMASRMAADQEKRIAEALRPGLSDEELVGILKAEGIDVTPNALKVFQAGLYSDKDITPELLELASDRGPVGRALRDRLMNAGSDRAKAEARLAEALQAQHERDDVLREHYGGRIKKQHFEKLIDDDPVGAMEQVLSAQSPDAINTLARHVVDSPTADDAARALGVTRETLGDKIRVGLATKDEVVQRAVSDVLQANPFEGATVAPVMRGPGDFDATRRNVKLPQDVVDISGARPANTGGGELVPRTALDGPPTAADTLPGRRAIEDRGTAVPGDETVYDPKMAKADLREQAGLGDSYHELDALDQRYPALRLQAREAVQKYGLTQDGWKALAKDYPALETGESMRLLARAKQEIEGTGATFGKMGGVIPPEAPRPTGMPTWRRQAIDVIRDIRQQLNALSGAPKGYVADKKFGDIQRMHEVLDGALSKIETGRKLDVFSELDYAKKRLGQMARPGQVLPVGAWPAQAARDGYERLRVVLEDEGLWGRGAAAQRNFNERLHRRLARQDGIEGRYLVDAGTPHPRDPWRQARRVDLNGVRRLVDELGEDAGAPQLKAVAEHLDEGDEINKLMREYFDMEPGALRAVEASEKSISEARAALKEALDAAKREKQMNKLQGRHGPSYGARGLLWAVLGGAPGALAAHVADQVMNPGRAIYWRGVLERFANQTESKAAKAVARMAADGPSAAVDAVSKMAKVSARATPKAIHIFDDVMSEDYLSRVKAYNATIKDLSGVAAGTGLTEKLTGSLGDSMMVAPQLLPKVAEHAQKVAQLLLSKAPPQPSNSFWGDDVAPVSDTQMQDFFRAYEIVTDPTKLLELAQRGELLPGDVQLAKEAAPDMVAWMQGLVAEAMAGSKPSYETRVQVSLLFDMPLDPTMQPDYIGSQQQLYARRFEQKPPRRSPSTFEPTGLQAQYRSETDKIEMGEAPR